MWRKDRSILSIELHCIVKEIFFWNGLTYHHIIPPFFINSSSNLISWTASIWDTIITAAVPCTCWQTNKTFEVRLKARIFPYLLVVALNLKNEETSLNFSNVSPHPLLDWRFIAASIGPNMRVLHTQSTLIAYQTRVNKVGLLASRKAFVKWPNIST